MKKFIIGLVILFPLHLTAQDLDNLLDEATQSNTDYVSATFKSTRIVNGHSVERMPSRQLDFRISHRFGELKSGASNFWGLDEANIHLSLEYGITNWVMVGFGRGNYQKTLDGFAKFTLIRQSKGARNFPVSISYLATTAARTDKWAEIEHKIYTWSRFSYVHQFLIARKFNERFSLELNPTLVHYNLVETEIDPNDLFSVGIGTRFKLSKRITVNLEYYYVYQPLSKYRNLNTHNPLSIGFDIETGGHVFQLFLSNSLAMIEKGFIAETTGNWKDAGVHFGFNISRVFSFKKKPE